MGDRAGPDASARKVERALESCSNTAETVLFAGYGRLQPSCYVHFRAAAEPTVAATVLERDYVVSAPGVTGAQRSTPLARSSGPQPGFRAQ